MSEILLKFHFSLNLTSEKLPSSNLPKCQYETKKDRNEWLNEWLKLLLTPNTLLSLQEDRFIKLQQERNKSFWFCVILNLVSNILRLNWLLCFKIKTNVLPIKRNIFLSEEFLTMFTLINFKKFALIYC